MTSDEQKLIELYRQLSEGDKNILMVILSRLAACEDVPNCRQVKVVNQFHKRPPPEAPCFSYGEEGGDAFLSIIFLKHID